MDSGLAPLRFAPRNDEGVVIFARRANHQKAYGKNSDAFVSRECELTSHRRRHSGARLFLGANPE
jgi:hypothetical protein